MEQLNQRVYSYIARRAATATGNKDITPSRVAQVHADLERGDDPPNTYGRLIAAKLKEFIDRGLL